MAKKKFSERNELLWRILVLFVSGFILGIWRALIVVVTLINWIVVLVDNKSNKDLANFCDYWNKEVYRFIRYLTMNTNDRPFPFTSLKKLKG